MAYEYELVVSRLHTRSGMMTMKPRWSASQGGGLLPLAIVSLLIVVTGCQTTNQPSKAVGLDNGGFMGLWGTYSHCQASSNLDELRQDVVTLVAATNHSANQGAFVLPLPGKLERYVANPSARLAVDVKAMGAACSLRAAQLAVEAGKLDAAKDFLRGVLNNHAHTDYLYYTSQAKALLSEIDAQVVQVTLNVR